MPRVTACSTLTFALSSLQTALEHIAGYGFDRVEIADMLTHTKHFSTHSSRTVDPVAQVFECVLGDCHCEWFSLHRITSDPGVIERPPRVLEPYASAGRQGYSWSLRTGSALTGYGRRVLEFTKASALKLSVPLRWRA